MTTKFLEYQWALVTTDTDSPAAGSELHFDTVAELQEWRAQHPASPTQQHRIALLRCEWPEIVYAFVTYGMLGEFFADGNGNDSPHRVPRNFQRELNAPMQS
jgi:hypothetical protein